MKKALLPALTLLLATSVGAVLAESRSYQLIVHAKNPTASLATEQISKLLLKREAKWPTGFSASPVDQTQDSPPRIALTREIHGKEVAWIKSYWEKMIFSGLQTPPPELRSDAEVMDYVKHNVGAIGYVSDSAELVKGVKKLEIEE